MVSPDSSTRAAMSEAARRRYLTAMGIPVWLERGAGPEPAVGEPLPDLDTLRERVAGCTACPLHERRTLTVFGVGASRARCMIIGEAPGAEEDRQGEPFVGRAGRLLDAMLAACGLDRQSVYIANIVKCRPPGNRDPRPEEVAACAGYLRRQIELVGPEVIVAAGRVAAHQLLGTERPIGRLRGQRHVHAETGLPVIVSYHPAYLLRRPVEKAKSWADLRDLRRALGMAA